MRRLMLSAFLAGLVAFAMLAATKVEASQEAPKVPSAQPAEKPLHSVYRLEFIVREVEDGKRLNSRTYTMSAEDDHRVSIRVGNRVPYVTSSGSTGDTKYQYYDVGTNIDCRLHDHDSYVVLEGVGIEISSIAKGESPGTGLPNPIVRSARASVDVAVTPGKSTPVTTLDDVSSDRRYEVEVTATKVK